MSEHSLEIENVKGTKIWDDTGCYFTELTINQSLQHNRPVGSQILIYGTYPQHTHNTRARYFSGSCTGNFSDNQSDEVNCESEDDYDDTKPTSESPYNFGNGNVKYVYDFIQWLHNDKLKYLQLSPYLVIPVAILDTIQWNVEDEATIDDGDKIKITFNWEQIADAIVSDDGTNEQGG